MVRVPQLLEKAALKLALALAAAGGTAAAQQPIPVSIGVDMAGSYHLAFNNEEYWSSQAWRDAVAELGGDFVNVHLVSRTQFLGTQYETAPGMLAKILRIDDGMRAAGLRYQLSSDDLNYSAEAYIDPSVNEFATPDGMHRWDLRPEWVQPLADRNTDMGTAFMGWVYDEAEHLQLENCQLPLPDGSIQDIPHLADTHGLGVPSAYAALQAACDAIRAKYRADTPIYTEQVVSDMFHLFARSGWRITPKLLSENFAMPTMSNALGAAIQYRDRTQLWAMADMYGWLGHPGHRPAALGSALKTAYWLGAEAISVENMDYPSTSGHPEADDGGLVWWDDADTYELTAHGEEFKRFAKEYVPAHPRTIDWRKYDPRVAIIRMPDGDWGLAGQPWHRNRLLGDREHPSDPISREWLQVWPILTHGALRAGAMSMMNDSVYPEVHSAATQPGFFQPIDSVASFDHTVAGEILDRVDCFIACGYVLSEGTFAALRREAAEGATCIVSRRLYAQCGGPQSVPSGWIVVDDFGDPRVAEGLAPFLGDPDTARFRFKDAVVEFRRGAGPDEIDAWVFSSDLIRQISDALSGLGPEPAAGDVNGDGKTDVPDLTALVRKFESRRR